MEAKKTEVAEGGVLRVLLAAQSMNAVGDGAYYVTAALFFSRVVGLSPAQVGVGLTIAWSVGFVLATPLGQLADRVGLRRAAIGLSLLTAVALGASTLPRSMSTFVAVTSVYAVAQSGSGAVRQALLLTLVTPAERLVARGRLQAAVNVGIGAGAALGGVALRIGTADAYITVLLADAAAFLAAAALLVRLPEPARGSVLRPSPAKARAQQAFGVLRDRPYVAASALNAVLYLYMPMLSVLLPLYIAQRTTAPTWIVAALFVLNTAGVAALQVRATRAVRDLRAAVTSIRRAGGVLLLACVAFAAAAHAETPRAAVLVLAAAAALQVLAEVMLAAGSWEIGFTLADPGHQGQWQGLFSSGIPLARALGPLGLTTLVLTWSGPGWFVLGTVFAVAAVLMGPVVAWGASLRTTSTNEVGACHRLVRGPNPAPPNRRPRQLSSTKG